MRPIHWIIVLIVVLVLFGAQKLPDLARSIGKSAKILKEEMNDLSQDSSSTSEQTSTSEPENTDSSK
ncbi:MAG: Sec-independent protein translocase subunit TatA [Actinomyces sp.]|jgi:sec-independent protein translocase protein tatA/E homolog|uniref:Sec-independent protein translocase protein TatA n=1 Tax=Schaalia odontolytica TaxID=1660 RepID=A0A6N2SEB9_9ACTO|nr:MULTISPECIES: Sec-independent protein translocase subunit TatA [Actinomycetaceae]MBF0962477.1 Sec-independent protein translocase subunit TatA [Actinomyces sp.]MBF1730485.1 Sec-independent protein translocase subunit TatA [Trueperella pyogenes]MDU2258969.1 Sec-independent protein translocase subunit TatA [Actinomyces sp.]MDU3550431.1 Sec-independent protein translocase subunit TatA [Actinomyces sp.]MDU5759197.1 Sec-independent protein translocase subunit TatA [Actinomyces sp.]